MSEQAHNFTNQLIEARFRNLVQVALSVEGVSSTENRILVAWGRKHQLSNQRMKELVTEVKSQNCTAEQVTKDDFGVMVQLAITEGTLSQADRVYLNKVAEQLGWSEHDVRAFIDSLSTENPKFGRICPKCGHQRETNTQAPAWQCPSCGIAYDKYEQVMDGNSRNEALSVNSESKITIPNGDKTKIRRSRMGNLSKGWHLIIHCLNVFRAYPIFLIPILGVWTIYASDILYMKYDYQWKLHSTAYDVCVVFLGIFAMSFLILMSCAMTLEMIRQVEEDKPSLSNAFGKVVSKDMFKVLPLSVVWAVIWFVLTIIEALLSRSKDEDNSAGDALTAQNAAITIANFRDFSFTEAFIEALQKGVRMVMFLIMPAIAWENLGFFTATKKGLAVLRAHLGLFGSGYALTYAAAAVVFLPAAIVLELGTPHHGNPPLFHFPDYVWVVTIIYMGFAWSLSIYLEQMFMAQLYLWHMKWEEAVVKNKKDGTLTPAFNSVARPELLDKTPGLFA